MNGKKIGKKAQVCLELGLSLFCVFLLLFASFKIFVWVNERMSIRQENYEQWRVISGGTPLPVEIQVDEATGGIILGLPTSPLPIPSLDKFLSELKTAPLDTGKTYEELKILGE